MSRKGFAKCTLKAGRVFSTFLLPPEVIWCPPYARGLRYHQPFREPIRLTNNNFHAHVHYCITIHYHRCSIDKYRNVVCLYGGGRYVWAQIHQSELTTRRSAWPKCWLNVKLTWCSISLGHQMPLLRGRGYVWPEIRLSLQWEGQPDPNADQMSRWPDVVVLLATRCLYSGMSELRSIWHKFVLLLSTRSLYQGVHLSSDQSDPVNHMQVSLTQKLTKCQADLMQYSYWPLDASTGGTSYLRSIGPG